MNQRDELPARQHIANEAARDSEIARLRAENERLTIENGQQQEYIQSLEVVIMNCLHDIEQFKQALKG